MRCETLAGLELGQLSFVASRGVQDARVVLLNVRLERPPIPDASSSRSTAKLTSTMVMVMGMVRMRVQQST